MKRDIIDANNFGKTIGPACASCGQILASKKRVKAHNKKCQADGSWRKSSAGKKLAKQLKVEVSDELDIRSR